MTKYQIGIDNSDNTNKRKFFAGFDMKGEPVLCEARFAKEYGFKESLDMRKDFKDIEKLYPNWKLVIVEQKEQI